MKIIIKLFHNETVIGGGGWVEKTPVMLAAGFIPSKTSSMTSKADSSPTIF